MRRDETGRGGRRRDGHSTSLTLLLPSRPPTSHRPPLDYRQVPSSRPHPHPGPGQFLTGYRVVVGRARLTVYDRRLVSHLVGHLVSHSISHLVSHIWYVYLPFYDSTSTSFFCILSRPFASVLAGACWFLLVLSGSGGSVSRWNGRCARGLEERVVLVAGGVIGACRSKWGE